MSLPKPAVAPTRRIGNATQLPAYGPFAAPLPSLPASAHCSWCGRLFVVIAEAVLCPCCDTTNR